MLNYCCTTPQPAGAGNISTEPQLASASHLSAASPCRGKGSTVYRSGTDIDGEVWANPPAIGCDEYRVGQVTGSLGVAIVTPFTTITPGYSLAVTALVEGRTTASVWNFGDGMVVSNRPYTSHVWTIPGRLSAGPERLQ